MTDQTATVLPQEMLSVLSDLGLTRRPNNILLSGHGTSLPVICDGRDGHSFLLKWYLPPKAGQTYPAGSRAEDFARREVGFYRMLDSIDPERCELPAPRTVLVGPGDPPQWLLLEWLRAAKGPSEEVLSTDHVFYLIDKLQALPIDRLLGRRDFPLNHWDPIGYLERIRLMYDSVLFVIGEQRWRHMQIFFDEAVRWTDGRKPVLVHGDFCEQNIVIDENGNPFLIDFERVGMGNIDHDIALFWIHTNRNQDWKRNLIRRWFGARFGGDRIRAEWGIRTTLALLAMQRLRYGYLIHGDEDPRQSANLAMLDATIAGGAELFPI